MRNPKSHNPDKKHTLSESEALPYSKYYKGILFLIAFFVYANTLSYDYACDDLRYTYGNLYIKKGVSAIPEIFTKGSQEGCADMRPDYRPIVLLSFAIEKSVFGLNPHVSHFINVLIYAILGVVIFSLLTKLFRQHSKILSLFITLLFILHPIHTEVVANIKSRDELLCMLFGLLSLNYIFKYQENKKNNYLFSSVFFFILCIFSKESGYCYLGIIPLILYFFTQTSFKKILLYSLPFAVVSLAGIIIRIKLLGAATFNTEITILENSLVATDNNFERTATDLKILLHGMYLLVIPSNLSWDYSYNQFQITNFGDPIVILSLLIHISLIVIAIYGLKQKKIFSFAILFYFTTFFLTSNLVILIASTFGERFLFTPSLAFCMALPFFISMLLKMSFKEMANKNFGKLAAIIICICFLYGFKTMDRNAVWRNNMTLAFSGLKSAPNSARVYLAGGAAFLEKAKSTTNPYEKKEAVAAAFKSYKQALKICPEYLLAYYNMGNLYYRLGDTLNAVKSYQEALKINSEDIRTLLNYSVILIDKGDYEGGLTFLLYALKVNPDINYPDIYMVIAACYQKLNNYSAAIPYLRKALILDPYNIQAEKDLTYAIEVSRDERGSVLKTSYEVPNDSLVTK